MLRLPKNIGRWSQRESERRTKRVAMMQNVCQWGTTKTVPIPMPSREAHNFSFQFCARLFGLEVHRKLEIFAGRLISLLRRCQRSESMNRNEKHQHQLEVDFQHFNSQTFISSLVVNESEHLSLCGSISIDLGALQFLKNCWKGFSILRHGFAEALGVAMIGSRLGESCPNRCKLQSQWHVVSYRIIVKLKVS